MTHSKEAVQANIKAMLAEYGGDIGEKMMVVKTLKALYEEIFRLCDRLDECEEQIEKMKLSKKSLENADAE